MGKGIKQEGRAGDKRGGVSFDVSSEDAALIASIAARAVALAAGVGVVYSRMDADMDLTACHANGAPLRLAALFAADDGNFGHDVFGIRRFLDRDSGQLGGFFSPRYSARKVAR